MPEPPIYDLLKDYHDKKPDFTQYIRQRETVDLQQNVEKLGLSEQQGREGFPESTYRSTKSKKKLNPRKFPWEHDIIMPVHPAEENVSGSKSFPF
jgi:hypothetical protein